MSKKRKTQHKKKKTHHKKRKPQPAPQRQKISWIELATEKEPLNAIPVLPRFQAHDLPDETGNRQDPDSITWLGERIWPREESCNDPTQDNNEEVIGEGRPEICPCQSPGSVECVRRHVTEERKKLRTELGPAFEEWKFDQMGETASCSAWSQREEKKFELLVKRNLSVKQSREESSWNSFRNKDRKTLVSYYFNVYIPRKISRQTRSGCSEVDSEDDVPSNSQKHEPNNDCQKTGTKSETSEAERKKSKTSESKKKSVSYAVKKKYLAGYR